MKRWRINKNENNTTDIKIDNHKMADKKRDERRIWTNKDERMQEKKHEMSQFLAKPC